MRERNPGTKDEPVVDYGGITRFVNIEEIPQGRFTVTNGGLPIDFFHDYVGARTTVVMFHGAVQSAVTLPWFVGKGILRGLKVNRLSISDPSLLLDRELTLGWYAGNHHQIGVQAIIRRIIDVVIKLSGVRHLVFMGGSGGGYAALDMSRRFPGSLALPMNPQTSIGNHEKHKIDQYLTSAWPGVSSVNDLPEKIAHDQVAAYIERFDNTVGYIQNARDARHIRMHFGPFVEAVGNSPNFYMLSDRWGDRSGSAHVPPPKNILHRVLRHVVFSNGNWEKALRGAGFVPPPGILKDRIPGDYDVVHD